MSKVFTKTAWVWADAMLGIAIANIKASDSNPIRGF
jgi:hypothetical protein